MDRSDAASGTPAVLGGSPGNEWGSELTTSAELSMEQSRRTAGAVCACIEEQGYASGLVALAVLAQLCPPQRDNASLPADPLLHSTRVTSEGLYRHRAIRNEFPLPDRVGEVLDPHIEALRRTALEQRTDPADRHRAAPTLRPRRGDTLFDIVRVKEWSDPGEWCSSKVSWLVRGGQWAYWGMNRSGRILLCRIAAACMSHAEPGRVSFTMRLGTYLGFSALLCDENDPLDLSVAQILRDMGGLPADHDGTQNGLAAIYARFGHALTSLREADALADAERPTASRLPARREDGGVPEGWLESRIRLVAPVIRPQPTENAVPAQIEVLKI